MGKFIARKVRGMNVWAKVGLITVCTLLLSTFMYRGWFTPNRAQAVAVTYNAQITATTTMVVATGMK